MVYSAVFFVGRAPAFYHSSRFAVASQDILQRQVFTPVISGAVAPFWACSTAARPSLRSVSTSTAAPPGSSRFLQSQVESLYPWQEMRFTVEKYGAQANNC